MTTLGLIIEAERALLNSTNDDEDDVGAAGDGPQVGEVEEEHSTFNIEDILG